MLSLRALRGFLGGALGVAIAWAAYRVVLLAVSPAQPLAALFTHILGVGPSGRCHLPLLTIRPGLLLGGRRPRRPDFREGLPVD